MFKKFLREFKRYDLDEMTRLDKLCNNLAEHIERYKKMPSAFGASRVSWDMMLIQEEYPLEVTVAINAIYRNELKEIYEVMKEFETEFGTTSR